MKKFRTIVVTGYELGNPISRREGNRWGSLDRAGGDRIERAVDPAASEDQVALVDGHDLAGSDGRLRGVENDVGPVAGQGIDRRGDGLVPGADLGQAGGR